MAPHIARRAGWEDAPDLTLGADSKRNAVHSEGDVGWLVRPSDCSVRQVVGPDNVSDNRRPNKPLVMCGNVG